MFTAHLWSRGTYPVSPVRKPQSRTHRDRTEVFFFSRSINWFPLLTVGHLPHSVKNNQAHFTSVTTPHQTDSNPTRTKKYMGPGGSLNVAPIPSINHKIQRPLHGHHISSQSDSGAGPTRTRNGSTHQSSETLSPSPVTKSRDHYHTQILILVPSN